MADYIASGYWTPDNYVGTDTGAPPDQAGIVYEGTISSATSTSIFVGSPAEENPLQQISVNNATTLVVVLPSGATDSRTVASISGSTITVSQPFSEIPANGAAWYLTPYNLRAVISELQKASPSSIIELFELQLVTKLHGTAEVWRFHAGSNMNANGEIVWAGNAYLRFPVEADGFEYSGNGQLPRPKIRVSNILGTITAILLSVNGTTAGNDLVGAKLTRIRTLARYLDAVNFTGGVNPFGTPDPSAELPREIYYVDRKVSETRDVVEFELAAAFDLVGVRAPKRQCIANVCQWVYRSAECGYAGANYWDESDNQVGTLALDVCGKRLTSCQLRFGTNASLPFGSFPGVGTFNT